MASSLLDSKHGPFSKNDDYLNSSSNDMSSGTKLRSNTFADRSNSVLSNSSYMCDAASTESQVIMA